MDDDDWTDDEQLAWLSKFDSKETLDREEAMRDLFARSSEAYPMQIMGGEPAVRIGQVRAHEVVTLLTTIESLRIQLKIAKEILDA